LDRVVFVRTNLEHAKRFLGFTPSSARGALVFSSPQPMMFGSIQSSDPDAAILLVGDVIRAIST
jgi:hypothetical protein